MKTVYAHRFRSSDHGTRGVWACPEIGFSAYSMEPPWRNNEPNFSCIRAGEYIAKIVNSPKYGKVYEITNVDGRSHILTHSGNIGGDRKKGLYTHTWGCTCLGAWLGKLRVKGVVQRAVLYSRPTVEKFMTLMNGEDFKIIITGVG